MNEVYIKRALLSCYDKTNLLPLAQALSDLGVELISTGGTKDHLIKNGINVADISTISERSEAFGGRIKSLSFGVSAGLLFDRVKDKKEAEKNNVKAIDLVVCNLYPFNQATKDNFVEWIDIGGPTMLRAAAKNYLYVTALSNPDDYKTFTNELKQNNGAISYSTRKELMIRTFSRVADYDIQIANSLDKWNDKDSLRLAFSHPKKLRYGENSHQQAKVLQSSQEEHMKGMKVLQGKELSYNNILDIQAAFDAIRDLKEQACCIIKHCTPCGISQTNNQQEAFRLAWAGDPVSAFGSIVIFNQEVNKDTINQFHFQNNNSHKKFIEIIIAPSFEKQALVILETQKNLRVVTYNPNVKTSSQELRIIDGGLLLQDVDSCALLKKEWVTDNINNNITDELIKFGQHCIRPMKSNAIAIVRQNQEHSFQLLGMGCGQPNRINSVKLAIERARDNLKIEYKHHPSELEAYYKYHLARAVMVSEAFFPFADNIDICKQAGINNIIQPGGSIRDSQVIDACNNNNMSMMFTETRHFKH